MSALRTNLTILVVLLYALLGVGFQTLRLPPGSEFGVPVAELLIILFLASFPFDYTNASAFLRNSPFILLLIWWIQGSIAALFGLLEHGIWAMRDATFVIESLFIWIGFVASRDIGSINRIMGASRMLGFIAVGYAFLYPFRELLQEISPQVVSPNGVTLAVLFQFESTPTLILAVAFTLIYRPEQTSRLALVLLALTVVYVTLFWQSRTIYLQIVALVMVFALLKRQVIGRIAFLGVLGFVGLLLFFSSGIEITGRLGEQVDAQFLIDHFQAIWGQASDATQSSAEGVEWRLAFWDAIWRDLNAGPWTLLTGLGFGQPLIDFIGPDGEIVRIPHNTLITILGRMGLIGLATFVAIHIYLMRQWLIAYRKSVQLSDRAIETFLVFVLAFFVCSWLYAIGEGSVELPYIAVPYYFLWGVVIRLSTVRLERGIAIERQRERGQWQAITNRS